MSEPKKSKKFVFSFNNLSKNDSVAKLKNLFKTSMAHLSNLFFPENIKCIFCDADILNFDDHPYCDSCAKELPFNNGHRCQICDSPLESEATVCDFCQKHHRNFKKAFCPFLYDGKVKNAILSFKNQNHRHLATGFSLVLAKLIESENVQIDVITYVPMTKEKENERTFNQSKLLAEKIGEILHLPVVEMLEKVKEGSEQKSLTFKQRQENVKKCFKMIKGSTKSTDNVLIVDDVITTCATIDTCAKLLKNKVKNVYVCAIARQYVRPDKPIILNSMNYQIFSIEDK